MADKEIEVQDTDDYKLSKSGRKIKAHRIIFNKGDDDGKKGITEMKKTYKDFVEQHTAELTEEQKDEIVDELTEALNGDLSAGEWIKDFVHSNNPKFEGKSKDKRKQMALAAYYAKQRNEGIEIDEASPIFNTIRANTLSHVTGFGRRSDDAAERHHDRMQSSADHHHDTMRAYSDAALEKHKHEHEQRKREHEAEVSHRIEKMKQDRKKPASDPHFDAMHKVLRDRTARYKRSTQKEEVELDEGRGDAVLKTTAKHADDNDRHVTTLRKAGLHASQGAGDGNHIIVPREHEKKARELLSKHLIEDAENIDEKITIDGKGNRVVSNIKFQPHDAASKTDASVRAYYAKLKAERDKKKQEAPVKEELKGNQHKLDKNKNGKLDKHDFKLLRKEDTVEESVFDWKNKPRQTSDSGKTKTYHDVKKVSTGTVYTKQFDKDGVSKGTGDDAAKKAEGAAKRGRGRPKKDKFAEAVEFLLALSEETFDDLMEEGFDAFIESYEQLDELSKSTLGSYIKKATNKMPSGLAMNAHQAGDAPAGSKERKGFLAKANKRIGGIAKAADRLTK
jgi:hypothetical protein